MRPPAGRTVAWCCGTPDEHYDYAITLINERKLSAARQHLLKGLEQQPEADHIYYALALCDGLSGDLQGAYENLRACH